MTPQRACRIARLQEELNDALDMALSRIYRRVKPNPPRGYRLQEDAAIAALIAYDGVSDPKESKISIEVKDYYDVDFRIVGHFETTLAEVFAELETQ